MNLPLHSASKMAARRNGAGFTLIEVMITMGLMIIVIGGVLSAQFVGLRQDQLMESKAGINDYSRRAISEMLNDFRGAKGYDIGTASSAANFLAISNGNTMQGSAVRLYNAVISTNQTINLTNYTIYYYDSSQASNSDGVLFRCTSSATTPVVVASNLISPMTFFSENWTGAVQTVRTYKGIIHTTLQFEQFQYPLTRVGTNGLYDYYRIECRATPHLPDGP
jgi:type II secretory pathway pseudopilin PulG